MGPLQLHDALSRQPADFNSSLFEKRGCTDGKVLKQYRNVHIPDEGSHLKRSLGNDSMVNVITLPRLWRLDCLGLKKQSE
jgi:hypothetical protein